MTAIQWVKQAWEAVKEVTVVNYFRHCGMQATVAEPTKVPFADLDENDAQLEYLVEELHSDNCMTASEYAEANNEVATCAAFKELETGVAGNGVINWQSIEEG